MSAAAAGNYVQRDPDNGAAMTEVTRVQVAYDDRYIYIAIFCEDGAPEGIAAGLGRRDEFPSTDYVSVGFDPRHDHLTGYVFQTNPSAVQADFSLTDDDREDRDYNAVWEVRTQIGERGWVAEFQIPFSQMRFPVTPAPGQVWGFQAERLVRRKGERGTWVAKPRGERGEVSLLDTWSSTCRLRHRGVSKRSPIPFSAPSVTERPMTVRQPTSARRSAPTHASGWDRQPLRSHGEPGLRSGRTGPRGTQSQRVRDLLS